MVDHPAKGCTPKQIEVFERIATGESTPGYVHERTLSSLERRGLIRRAGTKKVGDGMFAPFALPAYEVPFAVHAQWCQWCAENCEEEV